MNILCRLGFHKWGPWFTKRMDTQGSNILKIIEPVEARRVCLRCQKLEMYVFPNPNVPIS